MPGLNPPSHPSRPHANMNHCSNILLLMEEAPGTQNDFFQMSLKELPSSCGLSGKKTWGPPSHCPQSKDSWSCWQWTHPSAMDADISQPHGTSCSPASQGIPPDRSPGHLSLAGQDQRRSALSRRLCLSHKPGAWRAEQCKLSSSQVARSYETPAAGPPDRPRTGKEQEPEPHLEAEPPVPPRWAGRERHTRSKGGWCTWWVGLGARAAEPRVRGGGPTPTSPSFLRLKPRHPPK